jgi:hypothetical protein
MTIQAYDFDFNGKLEKNDAGSMVFYEDHKTVLARYESQLAEVIADAVRLSEKNAQLKAEIQKLNNQLAFRGDE